MEATPVQKVIDRAGEGRESLKQQEAHIRDFVAQVKETPDAEGFNKGECIAHAMIALRAVEDARMRLGKVIQYADGGESVYDKPKTA